MRTFDLDAAPALKEELEDFDVMDLLILKEENADRFVLMDVEYFEQLNELIKTKFNLNNINKEGFSIQIAGLKPNLSLEEYEKIKTQIIETLDKNIKPSTKYRLDQSWGSYEKESLFYYIRRFRWLW